ncbi:MAG TPA: M20/M25/M40 family metallo-hydrolase [Blastocatellia bacterium]|nr:M20/M25/M40 family metallo-hydrolase [Blastocatellia bacterium]
MNTLRKCSLFVLPVLFVTAIISGAQRDYNAEVQAITKRPEVEKALAYPDAHKDSILTEWRTITEIPAPSGKEAKRAAFVQKLLKSYGLTDIHIDESGNVIGIRKGTGGGPRVVMDAHLDTVFTDKTDVTTKVKDGRIYAPGCGDDTRNVEALLASIRALNEAKVKTKGDIVFVFTTREEVGLGGAEEYIKRNKEKIDYYVALDGGYEGFTYGGIGINWYKFHFIGPGGHTRSQTPPYSATLPLGRTITRIGDLKLPTSPRANLNIGMLGGSDVVNAKAADAWFSLDLRSTNNDDITALEKQVLDIANEEAQRAGLAFKLERISSVKAAQIPGARDSEVVKIAEAVHLAAGFDNPPITNAGSNNATEALLAGIPAISTGAGITGNSHAVDEWCDIDSIYKGIRKITLLELAYAGMQ